MFFSTNSSNSKNGHDPFPFPPDHSFSIPFSYPFEVDHQFDEYDLLFDNQPAHIFTPNITIPTDLLDTNTTNPNTNMAVSSNEKIKTIPTTRKRMSKKDRHSKITTARGLRDRRMRLSLPVARQFFGLQDMLGVDKGSKTVEWLLVQARSEILKLAKERNCSSYSNSDDHQCDNFVEKIKSLNKCDSKNKIKKRVKQPIIRKPKASKEMRELARARARARTMEKKNNKNQINVITKDYSSSISNFDDYNQNCTNKISSCSNWSSAFEETGEESGATHISYNNLNPAIEVEKPITATQFESSQPITDYQFQNLSSNFELSSYSTFNYHQLHQIENLDLQEQNEFQDSDIFG